MQAYTLQPPSHVHRSPGGRTAGCKHTRPPHRTPPGAAAPAAKGGVWSSQQPPGGRSAAPASRTGRQRHVRSRSGRHEVLVELLVGVACGAAGGGVLQCRLLLHVALAHAIPGLAAHLEVHSSRQQGDGGAGCGSTGHARGALDATTGQWGGFFEQTLIKHVWLGLWDALQTPWVTHHAIALHPLLCCEWVVTQSITQSRYAGSPARTS